MVSGDIQHINELNKETKHYLNNNGVYWVKKNFVAIFEIVCIMERNNYENGILYCYLRNKITGRCYNARGYFKDDSYILEYAGFNNYITSTEEYVFEDMHNFEKFLNWVEFEQIRYLFKR